MIADDLREATGLARGRDGARHVLDRVALAGNHPEDLGHAPRISPAEHGHLVECYIA